MEPQLAVMTGGTSGIGLHAARHLAARCRVLLVGRRGAQAIEAGQALPLDLSQLDTVRHFCAEVQARCAGQKIDILVLNAGGNFPHDKTADGFESNFAINHLAHYLMLRLLLPDLADGARIVITTSGTHDPAENTAIPAPKHADARRLAYPETDPDLDAKPSKAAGRAYSSAKLCNLLTAQALLRMPEIQARKIDVVAFSPGATPGTGLVSARGFVLGTLFRYVLPVMARFSSKMNTPQAAGRALADLALGTVTVPAGRVYALLRGGKIIFPDPSELARDDNAIDAMWRDSAALLGLDPAMPVARSGA